MYADFLGHTDLFTKISEQKNAEERMLAVLEFYLTSFHVGRKVHKMDSLENLVIYFFWREKMFNQSFAVPLS